MQRFDEDSDDQASVTAEPGLASSLPGRRVAEGSDDQASVTAEPGLAYLLGRLFNHDGGKRASATAKPSPRFNGWESTAPPFGNNYANNYASNGRISIQTGPT